MAGWAPRHLPGMQPRQGWGKGRIPMKPVPRTLSTNEEASVNPPITRKDSTWGTRFPELSDWKRSSHCFYLCSEAQSLPALRGGSGGVLCSGSDSFGDDDDSDDDVDDDWGGW